MSSFKMKISDIIVLREKRQRRNLEEIDSMVASLKQFGQLQPAIVNSKGELLVGERRLTAAIKLGWEELEVKRTEDLTEVEAQLIELEENVQRVDLSWQDECRAVRAITELMQKQDETIPQEIIAARIGTTQSTLAGKIAVANALESEDKEVIDQHSSWRSAYNYVTRSVSRAADAALDDLLAPPPPPAPKESISIEDGEPLVIQDLATNVVELIVPPAPFRIESGDSIEWMKNYSGPRFNFLHCDFPYGIDHGESDQGGAARHGAYEDSLDTYNALLQNLLEHNEKFLAGSCHVLFWFSMNHYTPTVQAFRDYGFTVNPMPLLWYKSDNVGIIPDAQRGPRQIYETALLISRGDRKIVKPVANVSAYPGRKSEMIHISEKPIEMLLPFFSMLIDRSTSMLDLTCGSGTSVRAALSAGASSGLGLELDPEMAKKAQTKLNSHMRGHDNDAE